MGGPDLRCAWHARLVSETRRVMHVCYTTYRTAVAFAICAALNLAYHRESRARYHG
ncbi:hypothetical protein BDV33DRAFT_162592 [Aspergillus novoparasiticus]|uniref:Uncharacterized protein n=1 Tax=Aspergillus novoparasiticus TaxID=986946 RepID=A0A5N6FAP6_9EURO|nr:hypothetical protein BDV33DRAFT_162592 [Aspergillus novoparasiticus]